MLCLVLIVALVLVPLAAPYRLLLPSWGVVSVSGFDRLRFLHQLATQSFEDMPTRGDAHFYTSFLNPQGKLIDYCRGFCTDSDVKLVCEAHRAQALVAYLNKFVFPLDRVRVEDQSKWSSIELSIGSDEDATTTTTMTTIKGEEMDEFILPGNDLFDQDKAGFTVVKQWKNKQLPQQEQGVLAGVVSDEKAWDVLRLQAGRPCVSQDLLAHNATALEAGLMHTLHFRKGCFLGNEVVSKQVATNAVRRRLVSLQIMSEKEDDARSQLKPGDVLVDEQGEAVGEVTSSSSSGPTALCFVKTKLAVQDQVVFRAASSSSSSNDPLVACSVLLSPFGKFDVSQSPAPPVERLASAGKQIVVSTTAAAAIGNSKSAEEERKAAKLAEMAKRVEMLKKKTKSTTGSSEQ